MNSQLAFHFNSKKKKKKVPIFDKIYCKKGVTFFLHKLGIDTKVGFSHAFSSMLYRHQFKWPMITRRKRKKNSKPHEIS